MRPSHLGWIATLRPFCLKKNSSRPKDLVFSPLALFGLAESSLAMEAVPARQAPRIGNGSTEKSGALNIGPQAHLLAMASACDSLDHHMQKLVHGLMQTVKDCTLQSTSAARSDVDVLTTCSLH